MAGTIIGMCKKPRSVHLGFLCRRRIRLGEFDVGDVGCSVLAAALVLIATRHDPLLSPDSITYLSAADHVRAGHGLTDFTGKSLAVFGPIFPLLLAPGGRSLVWATVVGATSIAAGGALMAVLLQRRVRPITALAGSRARCQPGFGAGSFGRVERGAVRGDRSCNARRVVALADHNANRDHRWAARRSRLSPPICRRRSDGDRRSDGCSVRLAGRRSGCSDEAPGPVAVGAVGISGLVIRNLIESGQALGPRFEGGAAESLSQTIRFALIGTGQIFAGDSWSESAQARIGTAIVIAVMLLAALALQSRRSLTLDLGVAAFAVTSLVVPIIPAGSPPTTSTSGDVADVDPLIYFVTRHVGSVLHQTGDGDSPGRPARLVDVPGRGLCRALSRSCTRSAGYKPQFAPQLYDEIDAFPMRPECSRTTPSECGGSRIGSRHLMGFTRPRPGNSHYPLDAATHRVGGMLRSCLPGLVRQLAERGRKPGRATSRPRRLGRSAAGGVGTRWRPVSPRSRRRQFVPIRWARMSDMTAARRPRHAARPRSRSRSTSSAAARPTRTASGCSAARWPARRWSPRPARSTTRAGWSTRCTPTSCARATRRCRSSTRSTASATAAASPPGASSPSSTAGRSSTCRPASTSHEPGLDHQMPMPPTCPTPRSLPDFKTRMAPYKERLGEWYDRPRPIDIRYVDGDPFDRQGSRCRPASGCGSGPTAGCPTIPVLHACVVTYASRHDPARHHAAAVRAGRGTAPACRWPASTTPCGSTARSAPTSGCCTTRRRCRPAPGAGWPAARSSPATARWPSPSCRKGLARVGPR